MSKSNLKWVVMGCAGSLFAIVWLVVSGGVVGYVFLKEAAVKETAVEEERGAEDEIGELIYGPDIWRKKEEEHNNEIARIKKIDESRGLSERYTVVYLHDDTRKQLYEHHNFEQADARLQAEWSAANSPLAKHRYSLHIQSIGELKYNEDPEALLATLDQWVDAQPENHLPRLVRGCFHKSYAWHFRNGEPAHRVTAEGNRSFEEHLSKAKDDLEEAIRLRPEDIESSAIMVNVAEGLSLGDEVANMYFEKTIAANPLHYGAWRYKLLFSQPKWGGSDDEIMAVQDEIWELKDRFPLLGELERYASYYLSPSSWNHYGARRRAYLAYHAQALQSPGDIHILADVAHSCMTIGDFGGATAAFRAIGDQFPHGSEYSDIPDYNRWRALAYAQYAKDIGPGKLTEQTALFEEAVALEPMETLVTGFYLAHLVQLRDDTRTTEFFTGLKDPYFATGSWGSPPDYLVMEAMAKAARSDDPGVKGKSAEKELLGDALDLAPDNAYVRLVNAEHHITLRDFDEAEIHLTRAREIDPDYQPALHIMGWLHFHQKRWDDGIAAAQEFLRSAPSPYVDKYTSDAQEIIALCEKKKQEGG